MKKSIWQESVKSNFDKIQEDKNTDILIIGAGITGVSTCYNLINSNKKVIMIDNGLCFNSTTSKSTGKLTYLQELVYQDIINIYDYEKAKLYYDSQIEGINFVVNNINKFNIDCSLEKVSNITYTVDKKEIEKFNKEKYFFDKYKIKYEVEDKNINDNNILSLIKVNDSYIFNPVKYLNGLLNEIKKDKNIIVYENSTAKKIIKEKGLYTVLVNDNIIMAKKIVLACHYPYFTAPGLFPFKTYMEKSYLSASKVKDNKKISGITSNTPTISFRFYEENDKKYLILLNNSSKTCDKLNYNKNYDELKKISKTITDVNPNYIWTNMDVMTTDHLPLIGKLSKDSNILIATGYNTWGLSTGSVASKIIVDILNNKENKYETIFDPTRKVNIKNFIKNTLYGNSKAYLTNFLNSNPLWYKNNYYVTNIKGKRVGVYIDENKKKHIVSNVCPHLKCFLVFNEVDKTWDCPCHSSRFDINGNVVKGPSLYDIKIDETKF